MDNTFVVFKRDGPTRTFTSASNGLYYYNMKQIEVSMIEIEDLDLDQIHTVETNTRKYNQRQLKNARLGRYLQNSAGMSTRALLKSID